MFTFRNAKYYIKIITVIKTYEEVVRLKIDHGFNSKIVSRKFSFLVENSYYKTVIDFNFGSFRMYLPLKVVCTSA